MRSYFMRSERIGFSVWSASDFALAAALWGDRHVTELVGGPFTDQEIRKRLELEISTQETTGCQYWPIFRLRDDVHLGCCGLRPRLGDDALEIGFHLLFKHWGHGYAPEAARAVMDHAFRALGVKELFAGHHPDNRVSQRLLERLGFRRVSEELYPPTGLLHPTYRLSREQHELAGPLNSDLPRPGQR